ncbi:MAG: hypothetical protein AAFX58_13645, partial [Pseudomonadota bacterium]
MTSKARPNVIAAPAAIVSLAAIGVIGNLAPFIMPVIVGGVVDHLGVSLAAAGYVAFADMSGLGIGAILWSRLIAAANWRVFAAVAVALVVAGNIACTLTTSLYPLMGARVVVGLGSGLLLAIGNSGLTMTRDPDRTIGIVTVIAMLSASVALYSFPLLVASYGVDSMFYGMAALTAIAGLGVFGMPARSPSRGRAAAGPAAPAAGTTPLGMVALLGVFLFFAGAIIFWVYVE